METKIKSDTAEKNESYDWLDSETEIKMRFREMI